MVEHIKEFIRKYLGREGARFASAVDAGSGVVTEIGELRSRDFEPKVRSEFVRLRALLTGLQRHLDRGFEVATLDNALKQLLPVLDHYRGEGSGGDRREFPYLHDNDLRKIVGRDYFELHVRLFPSGAWKSTVVMAGSILEAILHDLIANPNRSAKVAASPHATKLVNNNKPLSGGKWTLDDLIKVAKELRLIDDDREKAVNFLREFRNFIHPDREKRASHECNEAEAGASKYGLDVVCDHFGRTIQ